MSSRDVKRKILLIGKCGQVGRALCSELPTVGDVTALSRMDLDLGRPELIRETVRAIRPDVIVNAAAYTAVDRAESEEPVVKAINEDAPRILAEEAAISGSLLVHYSTDYVFDGTKGAPYVEDDAPNPCSAYGRTKLGGERAIQQTGAAHLIFRTAWVYAHEGRNFLLTVLRLATEKEALRIVRDQIGAPTWSREIASATATVLSRICGEANDATSFRKTSGVYHLTAAGEASWYDFAEAILQEVAAQPLLSRNAWFLSATQSRPLVARRVVAIATSDYPTPARRPAYSVLSNTRLTNCFGVRLPNWKEQLHQMLQSQPNICA